jgi:hypothetical protein
VTGTDFRDSFLTKYGELQSEYFDNGRLQSLTNLALSNAYEKLVSEFEVSGKISDELLPFIKNQTLVPGLGNVVLQSDITDYYRGIVNSMAEYQITLSGQNQTFRKRCTQLKSGAKYGFFGQGSFRYPKYEKVNSTFVIHPLSYTCKFWTADYIGKPQPIDIDDNATVLLYNDKFIGRIIDELLVQSAIPSSDNNKYQQGIQQEQINP